MNLEKHRFIEDSLMFIVQSQRGNHFSFLLDTKKLTKALLLILGVFGLFASGTLLFFRERALNQVLTEKIQSLETLPKVSEAVAVKLPEPVPAPPPVAPKPRIQEFTGACLEGVCTASLILSSPNNLTSEGSLLILMETLPPQIGSGNPNGVIRKKYLSYPPQEIEDNPSQESLLSLKGKAFKVNRSLSTQSEFKIGNLLQPVALHLYLFSPNHELIEHEMYSLSHEGKNGP